ncbi:unnamed protein product [Echinostoma caproni]|uniref:DUF3504 domain-containing protein n=1 Tax=Echinostoma caproni TaxID=27848 RepID=A0A183BB21_9TREM|nr:unnamed protein product [Echinostoma caproni]
MSFRSENELTNHSNLVRSPGNAVDSSYLDSFTGEAESCMENSFPSMNTSSSLLDEDTISAAMQAIAEASRFHTELVESTTSLDHTSQRNDQIPLISIDTGKSENDVNNHQNRDDHSGEGKHNSIASVSHFECGVKLETMEVTTPAELSSSSIVIPVTSAETHCYDSNSVFLDSLFKSSSFSQQQITEPDNSSETDQENSDLALLSSLHPGQSPSNPSETRMHSNWRPTLRPIFERVLIERLWTQGELGGSKPRALLLTMWFFISRHFGIGCRTEHARLVLGDLQTRTDAQTGSRCLMFVR